jgi:hypothetical protein
MGARGRRRDAGSRRGGSYGGGGGGGGDDDDDDDDDGDRGPRHRRGVATSVERRAIDHRCSVHTFPVYRSPSASSQCPPRARVEENDRPRIGRGTSGGGRKVGAPPEAGGSRRRPAPRNMSRRFVATSRNCDIEDK